MLSMTSSMKVSHSRCLCRGCGLYFNSTTAFSKHRIADKAIKEPNNRRCRTVDEMLSIGMVTNDAGYWMKYNREGFEGGHLEDD